MIIPKRIDKDRENFVELVHQRYQEQPAPEAGDQNQMPEERSVLPFPAQFIPFNGLRFFAFIRDEENRFPAVKNDGIFILNRTR